MNTSSTYKVNTDYQGQKSILVSTRMYSRNTLLNALHIKNDKYLGVNLDRYCMTFHSNKDPTNKNPEHEIAFSHIKSLEADVTQADRGKFYLKVLTDQGDLKFKFRNARDFHQVVEALRNTIHNDKPFYNASDSYRIESQKYYNTPIIARRDFDREVISSDEERGYNALADPDREARVRKAQAASHFSLRKDNLQQTYGALDDQKKREDDFTQARYDINSDISRDIRKDQLEREKSAYNTSKDLFKANKDTIKEEYKTQPDGIQDAKTEYKLNIKDTPDIVNERS